MTTPQKKSRKPEIAVEPGADKRLANILKKALNTPRRRDGKAKPAKPERKA